MGVKPLIFLGIFTSAIFVYLCIDKKKDAYYADLVKADEQIAVTKITTKEKIEKEIPKRSSITKQLHEASLAYVSGKQIKIAAILSKEDNNSKIIDEINIICQNKNCTKDIEFSDKTAPYHFTKDTLEILSQAKKEEIDDFALYINKKRVKIEGTIRESSQENCFDNLLKSFLNSGYTIENQLRIVPKIVPVQIPKPVVKEPIKKRAPTKRVKAIKKIEEPKDIFVTPMHMSINEASEKINNLLSSDRIIFDYKSSMISKESQKTLDEIVDILFGLDTIKIQVAGYTDAKGTQVYNKVLSQKRADAVRKYLINAGLRSKLITSKGYGSENPISDPKDIMNRRVEIHLIEGE